MNLSRIYQYLLLTIDTYGGWSETRKVKSKTLQEQRYKLHRVKRV